MKTLDKFLIKDIFKSFRKPEVGFFIDDIKPYNKAMASIRMRCYDMIPFLEKSGIHAELYKSFKKYQVVIFTKTTSDKSVRVAKKLKEQGVKVYFESYYEHLSNDAVQCREKDNIREMLKIADLVGVASDVQKEDFGQYCSDIVMIPESVHDDFFASRKQHEDKDCVNLIYCGYASKAKDTLCIKSVIQRLQKEKGCKMLYVCEKDPEIEGLDYEYIHYEQQRIPQLLMRGDIMIAPRPMEGIEKSAHSFTKAAYPLAVGLPTVASPMPSYVGTPVILCHTDEEWYATLVDLIEDAKKRDELGQEAQKYVYDNHSVDVIGKRYIDLINELRYS